MMLVYAVPDCKHLVQSQQCTAFSTHHEKVKG